MPASLPDKTTKRDPLPNDGTRQLLQWGGSMVGTGIVAIVLLVTVLGGYTRDGATTNSGWFALIVALMCLPFGGMLLLLGIAKWLRKYRERVAKGASKKEKL